MADEKNNQIFTRVLCFVTNLQQLVPRPLGLMNINLRYKKRSNVNILNSSLFVSIASQSINSKTLLPTTKIIINGKTL